MKYFAGLFFLAGTVALLTLGPAAAGNKFPNKDTAKNRQDSVLGTPPVATSANATIGTDAAGDSTLRAQPKPASEPVDWYDKVIITVNPNVNWPKTGTTTSTTYDNATDTQTSTTTTRE